MKNILITGASQGIGKATAIEAAKTQMFVTIIKIQRRQNNVLN